MEKNPNSAPTQLAQKLEKFYTSLDENEQKIFSEMVRSSLIHAAEHFDAADNVAVTNVKGAIEAFSIPDYVSGLTGENAPKLIRSLRFPGSLAAHGIPGCNASALVALRVQAENKFVKSGHE